MSIPFVDLQAQYKALKSSIDKRIQTVLDHGGFIMGPEVEECESVLAKYVGVKHAITCSSGTDAAVIALMAMGIQPGDEVITTAFSFIATAETIVLVGAKPVLVDIDPETFNIDPTLIEKAITPKTRAIMPVSLYGQPADMDEINAIARKHNLVVIEDAAQSFGAEYKGKKSCNLSDWGCTSFFPAKPLGCYGDGGAVFTNDDAMAKKAKEIRVHGSERRYYHTLVGINGRLDTIQCAILLAKMERYPWEVEQRQKIATRYTEKIQALGSEEIKTPVTRTDRTNVWAQYTLTVPQRDQFQKRMQELGVPTAVHYPITMADQPAYRELCRTHDIPVSRQAAQTVVSLPMHADLTEDVQDQIVEAIRKVL